MNAHHDDDAFGRYVEEALAARGRFGHREHIYVAWLSLQHRPFTEAVELVCDGIRRTAIYANAPQKYHRTVSEAWLRLVAHHVATTPSGSFDDFVAGAPALLDKRLLARHYTPSVLASAAARTGWVPPDRVPFPAAA